MARVKLLFKDSHKKSCSKFNPNPVKDIASLLRKVLWSDDTKIKLLDLKTKCCVFRKTRTGLSLNTLSPLEKWYRQPNPVKTGSLTKIMGRLRESNWVNIWILRVFKIVTWWFNFQLDNNNKHTARAIIENI